MKRTKTVQTKQKVARAFFGFTTHEIRQIRRRIFKLSPHENHFSGDGVSENLEREITENIILR